MSSDPISPLTSERLRYRRLDWRGLEAFRDLVADEYIRRYLLDGEIMGPDWCQKQLRASDSLFSSQGFGLWLVNHPDPRSDQSIGFCGFHRFHEPGPEPQLLCALLKAHTGQGYATEIARALLNYVRQNTRLPTVLSAVDEPNLASLRVLEKVGHSIASRVPWPAEIDACLGALDRIHRLHGNGSSIPSVWAELGHALFNVKEFIYIR